MDEKYFEKRIKNIKKLIKKGYRMIDEFFGGSEKEFDK